MFDHKIIITGSVGSGKTSAIAAYSDNNVINTDVKPSDFVSDMKDSTTVAMDYASILLDDETKVHLYGTPGQDRFDFMWDILRVGGMGLIVLVNHKEVIAMDELNVYLTSFADLIENVPVVVGISHVDEDENQEKIIQEYERFVTRQGTEHAQVMVVDCRKKEDIEKMILAVLLADAIF